MNDLVILGAGTAGTVAANKLRRRLPRGEWRITVVDRDDEHLYQPGLLFLPFGRYQASDLLRPRHRFLPAGVDLVLGDVDRIDAERYRVVLADGRTLDYDELVIASGVEPRPDQVPGLLGEHWRRTVFDFYTLDGAEALRERLASWPGGRLVVHVAELPIKCPVAPLEFGFLADDYFRRLGVRDQVEITYVTPLDGAFTRPVAARRLAELIERRRIAIESDFVVDRVTATDTLVSVDDRVVPFDLLVEVPPNLGAGYVARSGLGDDLNQVPVDPRTLRSTKHPNIFALGDANDLPTSKAGSVVHFSADVVVDNLVDRVRGRPMSREFDGHANCFVESGAGRALLLDFGYDTEPLPGRYPLRRVGPLTLLTETRVNHWGKLAFRWAYWHLLLRGRPLPVPVRSGESRKSE